MDIKRSTPRRRRDIKGGFCMSYKLASDNELDFVTKGNGAGGGGRGGSGGLSGGSGGSGVGMTVEELGFSA